MTFYDIFLLAFSDRTMHVFHFLTSLLITWTTRISAAGYTEEKDRGVHLLVSVPNIIHKQRVSTSGLHYYCMFSVVNMFMLTL